MSATDRYVGDFRRFASRAAADTPSWLAGVRDTAISRFAERGFPTTREEDWKYTNVAPLVSSPLRSVFDLGEAPRLDVDTSLLGEGASARLVFVDGRFSSAASDVAKLPAGLRVTTIAAALRDGNDLVERHLARHVTGERSAFAALSTAFLEDGAFVDVADGAAVDEPVELVFVSSGRQGDVAIYPRLLLVAGRRSRACLVERFLSDGGAATLSSPVAEIVLDEDAALDHVRIVAEAPANGHVATSLVVAARSARYASTALALGGRFCRHDFEVRLAGEGAECSLDGLYVACGTDLVDNHTTIDHAVPHGTSRELYKGILAGKAKGVFNGKVIVRPNAQRSDAKQTNKNLLLSRAAEIDTKPELQIFADDVKCAHGAAIGQLDPQALFYLESRGIGEEAGRRLLTRGFASELLDRIANGSVRAAVERPVFERVERCLAAEESR